MNKLLITLLLLPALFSLAAAKGPRYSDDGNYIAIDNNDDYQQSYVDVTQEAGIAPLASGDQPDTEIAERPDTKPEVEPTEGKQEELDNELPVNNDVNELTQNVTASNATAQGDTEVVDRPDTLPEVEPTESKNEETDEDTPSTKEKLNVNEQAVDGTEQSDTQVVDRPDTLPEVEPTEGKDEEVDDELPTSQIIDRPNNIPDDGVPSDGKPDETDEDLPFTGNEQQDQPDSQVADGSGIVPDETAGFVPDLSPEDTGFVPPEASDIEPTSGIAITGTVTDYIEPMEFIPQLEVDLTFVENGEQALGDEGEDKPIEGEPVLNWFSTGHSETMEEPQVDIDGTQMKEANWTNFTEGAESTEEGEPLQIEKIPHLETSQNNAETKEDAVDAKNTAAPVEATATEPVETGKEAEPVATAKAEEQGTPLEEDPNLVAYGDGLLINNPDEYSIVDYHGEEPAPDDQTPIDTSAAEKKPEKIKVEEKGFLSKKN